MTSKTAATLTARVLAGMAEVPAVTWDGLANPPGEPFNPFVSHAFLLALEQSGSATARTGWRPYHLLLEDAAGIAAVGGAIAGLQGVHPLVIVHGGGKDIDSALARAGIANKQVDGLRVADDVTLEHVRNGRAGGDEAPNQLGILLEQDVAANTHDLHRVGSGYQPEGRRRNDRDERERREQDGRAHYFCILI